MIFIFEEVKGKKDEQTTPSLCLVNDVIKVDAFFAC